MFITIRGDREWLTYDMGKLIQQDLRKRYHFWPFMASGVTSIAIKELCAGFG